MKMVLYGRKQRWEPGYLANVIVNRHRLVPLMSNLLRAFLQARFETPKYLIGGGEIHNCLTSQCVDGEFLLAVNKRLCRCGACGREPPFKEAYSRNSCSFIAVNYLRREVSRLLPAFGRGGSSCTGTAQIEKSEGFR